MEQSEGTGFGQGQPARPTRGGSTVILSLPHGLMSVNRSVFNGKRCALRQARFRAATSTHGPGRERVLTDDYSVAIQLRPQLIGSVPWALLELSGR